MSKNEYQKKEFAKMLRQDQTIPEILVWSILKNNQFRGLKFRRQHVIDGYVVDFYCQKLKLAIELDGKSHQYQQEYDESRQADIEAKGISVIRIKNYEIRNNIEVLYQRLNAVIQDQNPPSPD